MNGGARSRLADALVDQARHVSTLVYGHAADRFRITSWGDMVEMWERRYGRVGDEW